MLDVSSSISLPRGSDETGRKGEWVLDVDKVEERKEGWRLTERVILVLGGESCSAGARDAVRMERVESSRRGRCMDRLT